LLDYNHEHSTVGLLNRLPRLPLYHLQSEEKKTISKPLQPREEKALELERPQTIINYFLSG